MQDGWSSGTTNRETDGIARYRRHAANCLSGAQSAADPRIKLALIDMAHVWVMLAEEAERNGGRLLNCNAAGR
jgi:hypothetical protein